MRLVEKVARYRHQLLVVAKLDEQTVKAVVGLGPGHHVLSVERPVHGGDRLFQPRHLLRPGLACGELLRGGGFEAGKYLGHVANIPARERLHAHPATGNQLHEALLFKPDQGFPNRRAAHPEPERELLFQGPEVGRELVVHDLPLQLCIRSIDHGTSIMGAGSGRDGLLVHEWQMSMS
jgi:hypothetical protein